MWAVHILIDVYTRLASELARKLPFFRYNSGARLGQNWEEEMAEGHRGEVGRAVSRRSRRQKRSRVYAPPIHRSPHPSRLPQSNQSGRRGTGLRRGQTGTGTLLEIGYWYEEMTDMI